ncbi:Rhodanese-like domain-containing protein [Rhexocercosporidium sp. MPI-PUGE-AT-0058]|nr:Rhodanese-like domain-containing protein [Rhexocercosporidium sp. MPI-PUGE-AT-0058]
MSTFCAATSILLRTSRCSIPRTTPQLRLRPNPSIRAIPAIAQASHARFYSQEGPPSKIYSFEDVKAFVEKPDPDRILIDSREPGELQATGTIPGSLNIPITTKPDSFFITAEEFEDRFGFERPGKDQEVVFYCKSGVRSRAAAALARQAGWGNVAEYQGSWLDWDKNGGIKEDRK